MKPDAHAPPPAAPANAFEQRLAAFGIDPGDLEETFARSSGPGGQNVNKVSTAVTLRHAPSGLAVTVQDSRSQLTNRRLARERFLALLAERRRAEQQARVAAREKRRRQNSRRPRALKERILDTKRRRAQLKKLRQTPD